MNEETLSPHDKDVIKGIDKERRSALNIAIATKLRNNANKGKAKIQRTRVQSAHLGISVDFK